MGIYMYNKKMIVETLSNCLDDIEGDFTQKELIKALEFLKKYPYVCDKTINDKKYRKELLNLKC